MRALTVFLSILAAGALAYNPGAPTGGNGTPGPPSDSTAALWQAISNRVVKPTNTWTVGYGLGSVNTGVTSYAFAPSDLSALSNGVVAVGQVATGAVQRAGDTNLSGSFVHYGTGAGVWNWYPSQTSTYPRITLSTISAAGPVILWAQNATNVATIVVDTNSPSSLGSLARVSGGGTRATIWDRHNDGAGSGLDADLLDGQSWTSAPAITAESFTGNAAGLTNLPLAGLAATVVTQVVAGAGVSVAQTGSIVYVANPYATFWTTNVLTATNRITLAVPSNSAATGLEITIRAKSPASDPYGLYQVYFTANGATSPPALYMSQRLFMTDQNLTSFAQSNAVGGIISYIQAPHGITNTLTSVTLTLRDIHDNSQPKYFYSRWADRADGNATASAYQYAGTYDGQYTVGATITQVSIWAESSGLFDTGTVVRARLIP